MNLLTINLWKRLTLTIRRGPILVSLAWSYIFALLSQSIGRRRVFIVLAGLLVCTYALTVLAYVRSVPDIGLRFGFTTAIQHVDADSLHSDGGPKPEIEDKIIQLGNKPVATWDELLRYWAALDSQPYVDLSQLPEDTAWREAQSSLATQVRIGSDRWVRIHFYRADGNTGTTWAKLGRPALETLAVWTTRIARGCLSRTRDSLAPTR